MMSAFRVHFTKTGLDGRAGDVSDLREHLFEEGSRLESSQVFQISLEVIIRELVP